MKTALKLTIFIIIIFICKTCTGQYLRVSPLVEKTVMGMQVGTEVSYRMKNLVTIGGFYQKNAVRESEFNTNSYEFAGVSLAYPFARCERIMVSGKLRAGLSNERFAVVTPSVETEVFLTRRLSLNMGLGFRASEAAILSNLTWSF